MAATAQLQLFGRDEPAFDETFARAQRVALEDGAWIDYVPGWLRGDASLFEALRARAPWRAESRQMYDRHVDVPRLHAVLDGLALDRAVDRMRAAIEARYRLPIVHTSAALYRDGRDSVAWHGDYPARKMAEDTIVASVSLGAPRTFLVRRRGGGPSRSWSIGGGDLLVMGGACQRTHEHAVPKVASAAPRIALMYRPFWHPTQTPRARSSAG
jgi:alkylated DNA repair dioxygenase AlkB